MLKFIGILFIYVGHYTDNAGLLYPFVFEFHVPLFFFLSGCTEHFNRETGFIRNVWKKCKTVLLPFYAFGLVSIVFSVLIYGGDLAFVKESLLQLAQGCVRSVYFASSLWFFSCLFVVGVLFQLLKKLRKPWLLILASLALFLLLRLELFPVPVYYNLHYALYYQLFYVIGYTAFPAIHRLPHLTAEAA